MISRSWLQAIQDRIFWKNLLKNKEMVFENGIKNIQAAAYNDARTVFFIWPILEARAEIKYAPKYITHFDLICRPTGITEWVPQHQWDIWPFAWYKNT